MSTVESVAFRQLISNIKWYNILQLSCPTLCHCNTKILQLARNTVCSRYSMATTIPSGWLYMEMVTQTLVHHGSVSVCSSTHTHYWIKHFSMLTCNEIIIKKENASTYLRTSRQHPHHGFITPVPAAEWQHTGVRTPGVYIYTPTSTAIKWPTRRSLHPQLVTSLALEKSAQRRERDERNPVLTWCTGYKHNDCLSRIQPS